MIEAWKDIIGYEGRYQISSFGRVKKLDTGIIKCAHVTNGYMKVQLKCYGTARMFWVHRLVAIAFIPNPGECAYVNHKDRDRLNNLVENLEWATPLENTKHWMEHDRQKEEVF